MYPISWTVEHKRNALWELSWWPRGDFFSPKTRVELKSDNFLDAVKQAKYVLNM